MESKEHTCCFFGHRKMEVTEKLKNRLKEVLERFIVEEKVDTFLFGSKSMFDDLCLQIVTELKQKHSHIIRIYVRGEFPDIDEKYTAYLLTKYEKTYYPKRLRNAGKAVYVERNYEMIEKSAFCVVYFNEIYRPPKRKNGKKDVTSYQPKSGTKLAYDYAVKKELKIVNVCPTLSQNFC